MGGDWAELRLGVTWGGSEVVWVGLGGPEASCAILKNNTHTYTRGRHMGGV